MTSERTSLQENMFRAEGIFVDICRRKQGKRFRLESIEAVSKIAGKCSPNTKRSRANDS